MHKFKVIGENTAGFVLWCQDCGAVKDEDKDTIEYPSFTGPAVCFAVEESKDV